MSQNKLYGPIGQRILDKRLNLIYFIFRSLVLKNFLWKKYLSRYFLDKDLRNTPHPPGVENYRLVAKSEAHIQKRNFFALFELLSF